MRTSMINRVAAVAAAVGLAGAGVGMLSTTASAAPAGANLDLCVDSGADFSAYLAFPSGFKIGTTPGRCSTWVHAPVKKWVEIRYVYHDRDFEYGHFTTNGEKLIVTGHGSKAAGTVHFTDQVVS